MKEEFKIGDIVEYIGPQNGVNKVTLHVKVTNPSVNSHSFAGTVVVSQNHPWKVGYKHNGWGKDIFTLLNSVETENIFKQINRGLKKLENGL